MVNFCQLYMKYDITPFVYLHVRKISLFYLVKHEGSECVDGNIRADWHVGILISELAVCPVKVVYYVKRVGSHISNKLLK